MNQNNNPQVLEIMKNIQTLLREQLEEKYPGSKKILEELDAEVLQGRDAYRKTIVTEFHAVRLAVLVLTDLDFQTRNPWAARAKSLMIEAEDFMMEALLSDGEAREKWARRHELKKEFEDGLQHEQKNSN